MCDDDIYSVILELPKTSMIADCHHSARTNACIQPEGCDNVASDCIQPEACENVASDLEVFPYFLCHMTG